MFDNLVVVIKLRRTSALEFDLMPRKALILKAQSRVVLDKKVHFSQTFADRTRSIEAISEFYPVGTRPDEPPINDVEKIKNRMLQGPKIREKIMQLCLEEKIDDVVSAASEWLSSCNIKPGCECHTFHDVAILYMRALAYFDRKQYKFVVQDTTAGLNYASGLLKLKSSDEQKNFKNATAMKSMQRDLLVLRASSTEIIGEFEDALTDLRAAIALEVELGRNLAQSNIQVKAMILLARIKAESPRPHFTAEEIRCWNKELQIKEYAPENRACSNCALPPAPDRKLLLCGQCKVAWFCGIECQRISWPKHKIDCRNTATKKIKMISIKDEATIRADIADRGYSIILDTKNGPAVLVCDSSTKQVYESLSDQDVMFLENINDRTAVQGRVSHCYRSLSNA